ncbi:MAG: hypothetical protein AAGB93_08445 [Planctomycetota bacterium]
MWNPPPYRAATVLVGFALLATLAEAMRPALQKTDGLGRTREEVFVQTFRIGDLTGRDEADRLRRVASDASAPDWDRLTALIDLEALEDSGEIARSTEDLARLLRVMLNPPFDEATQSLVTGNGRQLLMSGNRMQHHSARLLLRSMRSEDRHVTVRVRMFEVPPAPLPASLAGIDDRSAVEARTRYGAWLLRRIEAIGLERPTFDRRVEGEVGRPIRIAHTRKVPLITDYRRTELLDSTHAVFAPVMQSVVEGPQIEVLVGRFGEAQLVTRVELEHRAIRRPVPMRRVPLDGAGEVLVQEPTIDVARGKTTIHSGFGTPIQLSTTDPVPVEPRTDYVVVIEVGRASETEGR